MFRLNYTSAPCCASNFVVSKSVICAPHPLPITNHKADVCGRHGGTRPLCGKRHVKKHVAWWLCAGFATKQLYATGVVCKRTTLITTLHRHSHSIVIANRGKRLHTLVVMSQPPDLGTTTKFRRRAVRKNTAANGNPHKGTGNLVFTSIIIVPDINFEHRLENAYRNIRNSARKTVPSVHLEHHPKTSVKTGVVTDTWNTWEQFYVF